MNRNRNHRQFGQINPMLVIVIVLVLTGVAAATWYFMHEEPAPADLKVLVDGKEVDAKAFMKDAKIELKGGPTIDLANPHKPMQKLAVDYFALPAGPQRLEYLDDVIDQNEKAIKELGIVTSADGTPKFNIAGPTTKPGDGSAQPRSTIILSSGGPGAADSMPPESRAQMAEYLKAINDRRAARGLPPQRGMTIIRTNEQK